MRRAQAVPLPSSKSSFSASFRPSLLACFNSARISARVSFDAASPSLTRADIFSRRSCASMRSESLKSVTAISIAFLSSEPAFIGTYQLSASSVSASLASLVGAGSLVGATNLGPPLATPTMAGRKTLLPIT